MFTKVLQLEDPAFTRDPAFGGNSETNRGSRSERPRVGSRRLNEFITLYRREQALPKMDVKLLLAFLISGNSFSV